MGLLSNTWMGCLLSLLPGPPGIRFYNAYFQMYPVDKLNIYCPEIDPQRDIVFRYHHRYSSNKSQEIRTGDTTSLELSGLDLSLPTVIYFPPFFEGNDGMSGVAVKDAYLERGGYNFILVDSKRLVAGPWYPAAVTNTYIIGQYAATFIDFLLSKGLSYEGLHLIGMSIGAHAAGVAGHFLKTGLPPRITGLDPASILFRDKPLAYRLDKSDAKFVDVIHTDGGVFGMAEPMGHADFYVNSGRYPQPGCEIREVARKTRRVLFTFFCGHLQSYRLYASSVLKPNAFPGFQCSSWKKFKLGYCQSGPVEYMGMNASTAARGNFYVPTGRLSLAEEQTNEIT